MAVKNLTVTVFVSLALAACGSSSSDGTTTGTDGGPSSTGAKDGATVCAYIASADLQALLKGTISKTSPVAAALFYECNYQVTSSTGSTNSDMHVNFYPSDAAETSYGNLKRQFPSFTFNDLTGVGDKAYWFQSVAGQGAPTVVVHKASASCTASVPQDAPLLDLTFDGLKVSSADAQAYAVKLGKLCIDVFNGYGS